jgi:hypothetical protein
VTSKGEARGAKVGAAVAAGAAPCGLPVPPHPPQRLERAPLRSDLLARSARRRRCGLRLGQLLRRVRLARLHRRRCLLTRTCRLGPRERRRHGASTPQVLAPRQHKPHGPLRRTAHLDGRRQLRQPRRHLPLRLRRRRARKAHVLLKLPGAPLPRLRPRLRREPTHDGPG